MKDIASFLAKRAFVLMVLLAIAAMWLKDVDLLHCLGGPDANDRAVACALDGDMRGLLSALRHGASADASDNEGATALMHAASSGHLNIMRRLVQAGADVNHTDNHGRTALMYAANSGRLSAMRLLLQAGADVNRTDVWGQSAMTYASRGDRAQAMRLLRENNADPS
jgi:ankyrin repeat protein